MAKVNNYLYRMFKFSRRKILFVWTLDCFSSLIGILTPMLLGRAIDGLINGDYRDLWVLLGVLVVEVAVGFMYRFFDTRTYERIAAHFKEEYLHQATEINIDTDEIDANIELIDDFPEFLRWFIINIFVLIGIAYPLWYLFVESERIVFLLALVITLIVMAIQLFFCIKKQKHVNQIKDQNEKRRTIIGLLNLSTYRHYINKIVTHNIKYSDKEALCYLICSVVQLGLLVFSIYFVVTYGNATAGIIFATVTYILELNGKAFDLSDVYEQYLNLQDSVNRVDI